MLREGFVQRADGLLVPGSPRPTEKPRHLLHPDTHELAAIMRGGWPKRWAGIKGPRAAVGALYVVKFDNVAITTAVKTYLEFTAPASPQFAELYHAWVDFDGSATGTSALVELCRKSGAATGTASPPTVRALSGSASGLSPVSAASVRWQATAEGTVSESVVSRYVAPNGSLDLIEALGQEVLVPGGGIIALRVTGATGVLPKGAFGFKWRE